jgi:hypothetical protein
MENRVESSHTGNSVCGRCGRRPTSLSRSLFDVPQAWRNFLGRSPSRRLQWITARKRTSPTGRSEAEHPALAGLTERAP